MQTHPIPTLSTTRNSCDILVLCTGDDHIIPRKLVPVNQVILIQIRGTTL